MFNSIVDLVFEIFAKSIGWSIGGVVGFILGGVVGYLCGRYLIGSECMVTVLVIGLAPIGAVIGRTAQKGFIRRFFPDAG